jgi:hypothetical protein
MWMKYFTFCSGFGISCLISINFALQVMFSTDAYAFPELFYLGLLKTIIMLPNCEYFWFKLQVLIFVLIGAKNAREVVFTVLRDSCIDGDITVPEAVEIAKDLFARNSINFYKISN